MTIMKDAKRNRVHLIIKDVVNFKKNQRTWNESLHSILWHILARCNNKRIEWIKSAVINNTIIIDYGSMKWEYIPNGWSRLFSKNTVFILYIDKDGTMQMSII